MTNWTWRGGSGLWTDPTQWLADGVNGAPLPDDTESIDGGTVDIPAGDSLDAETVSLSGLATLAMSGDDFGNRFTIQMETGGTDALVCYASVGYSGTLDVFSGTLDIGTPSGAFMLNTGGQVQVFGATLDLWGTLDNHATITVDGDSTFIDNGTVAQSHAAFIVLAGGTLAGSGAFDIGLYSSLWLYPGAAPTSQDVTFTGPGGRLLLGEPGDYGGTIDNFQQGDLIDLTNAAATSATFDAATGSLLVYDGSTVVASLVLQDSSDGQYVTAADGSGGTVVEVQGTLPRTDYTIDGPDEAMGANGVRATLTTHAGAPIDGAGVTVGIISDSVDPTQIAAAIADGFLPASGIDILPGYEGTGDDEGLAMAEEIHQVAPGATLDFATAGSSLQSYADAITALQDAGCNVIVDDVYFANEPFFQDAGPVDAAAQAAIADGVSIFSAAGNDADASYQAAYNPQDESLGGGAITGPAEVFSNGSPYQTITLSGSATTTIALQWAENYGAPQSELSLALFDMNGNLLETSVFAGSAPEAMLTIAPPVMPAGTPAPAEQYQLAITGSAPVGTAFKYVLFGTENGGSAAGGTIDDPQADNAGTVIGLAMLPDVNAVGAVDYAETPAFGSPATFPDYYSATGPDDLLVNPDGTPSSAAEPTKPNLLAPVGAATDVSGFAPFQGTSAAVPNAAGVAALMLQADPSLSPAQVSSILQDTAANLGLPATEQGAGLVQAVPAVEAALAAACFAAGTRIATARGEVPVEQLRRGDLVRLAMGGTAPIVWLGQRTAGGRADPPVCIAAHAFGPGRPARDLLLSPDHAVFAEGALIPVRHLCNGATVTRRPVPRITYWHVELPRHGVLLAEGLPAESYLDTGNRGAFDGETGPTGTDAALARRIWHARACAPLVLDGPILARVRATLRRRARALGYVLTQAPHLRVLADGRVLAPRRQGTLRRYAVPTDARELHLLSRAFVPAEMADAPDPRRLGVAVRRIGLDGDWLKLDDVRLGAGWHAAEAGWRWTDGAAVVRAAGVRALALELAITGRYWRPAG